MAVQENRLDIANVDLEKAQAELDAKQAELDVVQGEYEKAMMEKQVSTKYRPLYRTKSTSVSYEGTAGDRWMWLHSNWYHCTGDAYCTTEIMSSCQHC